MTNNLVDIVDAYSETYGKHAKHRARRFSYDLRVKLIKRVIQPSMNVLDIGTATGDYAADLGDYVKGIIGLDYDRSSLSLARRKSNKITLVGARAQSLPFSDGSFDAVTILNAFRYFSNPLLVLRECRRVLGKRGFLVLIDHNRHCPDTLFVRRSVFSYYSHNQFDTMFKEAGFMVIKSEHLFVPFLLTPERLLKPFDALARKMMATGLKELYPELLFVCERG